MSLRQANRIMNGSRMSIRCLGILGLQTGLIIACCGTPGCHAPAEGLYKKLQSEDPTVRLEGVIEAGRRQDPHAVPYLVDRL